MYRTEKKHEWFLTQLEFVSPHATGGFDLSQGWKCKRCGQQHRVGEIGPDDNTCCDTIILEDSIEHIIQHFDNVLQVHIDKINKLEDAVLELQKKDRY